MEGVNCSHFKTGGVSPAQRERISVSLDFQILSGQRLGLKREMISSLRKALGRRPGGRSWKHRPQTLHT